MMKPMSEVQRDQLADEYWTWFKENELKRWRVFSLKDDNFFSNGKEVKTMLKNDRLQEIFNRPILRGKEKNKCNQISKEIKKYLKSIGFEIPSTKEHIEKVIKKELDNKYRDFNVKLCLPAKEKTGLAPEIQYIILKKYICLLSKKLIGKRENKKLTWEKRIDLILKKILIMEEKEMNLLILNMKDFRVTKIIKNGIIGELNEEMSKKVIKDFFISSYERMRDSEFKHKILFKYFPVCPYCNATYLFKLREKTEKETNYVGAQLDHCYPKDKYPYLAISIFNLVPSCPTCNHIKGSKEKHLHPYFEEMGNNARFTLSMSCLAELEGIKNVGFSNKEEFRNIVKALGNSKILDFYLEEEFEKRVELNIKKNIDKDLKDRIKNSKDIFQLENKYSGVREEIRDLYFKHKLLNQSQREETLSQFGDSLGITPEEMEEVYFGARKTDPHKRPLSKFINDIRDFLDDEDQDDFE